MLDSCFSVKRNADSGLFFQGKCWTPVFRSREMLTPVFFFQGKCWTPVFRSREMLTLPLMSADQHLQCLFVCPLDPFVSVSFV